MVVRQGPGGRALLEGEQVQVGGNEVYVSLCRKHFRSATGDRGGRGLPLPSQQPSQQAPQSVPRKDRSGDAPHIVEPAPQSVEDQRQGRSQCTDGDRQKQCQLEEGPQVIARPIGMIDSK